MINVRDKILELVEMGLSKDDVILACLKYMSVDEVKDMALYNDFLSYDDFDVRYQDRSYKTEYNNGFELLNTLGNTGWFYRDKDGGRVRRLYTRGDNK